MEHNRSRTERRTLPAHWRDAWHRILVRPLRHGEDLRRREYVLNLVLIASIAALLVLDALAAYHAFFREPVLARIPSPTFSVLAVFFAVLLALSRRGHTETAARIFVGALILMNAYASLRWGIDLPVTLLAYAFVISTAGIVLGNGAGFTATLAAAFLVPGIWLLHVHGVAMPRHQYPSSDEIAIVCAFYFLIMTVSWISNREITRSLARARRSERALMKERDLLDVRIAERTEELRRAQFEEVANVHRLAEFGQLSSGLFHDLLGILTALSLRTEGSAGDEPSLAAAYETTRQLRRFMCAVREQAGMENAWGPFPLAEGVAQAVELVSYKARRENVRISIAPGAPDLLAYSGAAFKFHQIVINLLTNAIDAYRTIPADDPRRREVVVHTDVRNGNFSLSVEDFGCGIPSAVRARIFSPFFTTKGKTDGIGIGLSTVKSIVENDFHGTVRVESREGSGSVFTVSFPLRHPSPDAPQCGTLRTPAGVAADANNA